VAVATTSTGSCADVAVVESASGGSVADLAYLNGKRLRSVLLVLVGLALIAVSASSAPAATGRRARQEAKRATRDFGHLLRGRFGSFDGYYTCPAGQLYGTQISCRSEFHQGTKWFSAGTTADVARVPTSFSRLYVASWHRRWSPYSSRVLRGFNTPGVASVNTPYYDWAFLAAGAHYAWTKHRHLAVLDAFDGQGLGFGRFENFTCRIGRRRISCRNHFGDGMRYRPLG
jgi:hypothetical protein